MKNNDNQPAFFLRVVVAWISRSPWAVVCAMLVSIAATWVAGQEVKRIVTAMRAGADMQTVNVASLLKVPLAPPELNALSIMLTRVTPAVSIKPDGKKLKVWVDSASNYPDWMLALSTMQSYQKGLVWDVSIICTSCEGKAAYAEVEPYVQKIVWK